MAAVIRVKKGGYWDKTLWKISSNLSVERPSLERMAAKRAESKGICFSSGTPV